VRWDAEEFDGSSDGSSDSSVTSMTSLETLSLDSVQVTRLPLVDFECGFCGDYYYDMDSLGFYVCRNCQNRADPNLVAKFIAEEALREELTEQSELFAKTTSWMLKTWVAKKMSWLPKIFSFSESVEDAVIPLLHKTLMKFECSVPIYLSWCIPEKWLDSEHMNSILRCIYPLVYKRIDSLNKLFWGVCCSGVLSSIDYTTLSFPSPIQCILAVSCSLLCYLVKKYGDIEDTLLRYVSACEAEGIDTSWTQAWLPRMRFCLGVINNPQICLLLATPLSLRLNYFACLVLPLTGVLCFYISALMTKLCRGVRVTFERHRELMPTIVRNMRESVKTGLIYTCITAGIIYAGYKAWKSTQVVFNPIEQGNLQPTTIDEVRAREAEKNPWMEAVVRPLPTSGRLKNMTREQVQKKVEKNLCHLELEVLIDDRVKIRRCNALFIKSNFALIPHHTFAGVERMAGKFTRFGPKVVGSNFRDTLETRYAQRVGTTDLCLVWIPSGGDWADITHLFLTDSLRRNVVTKLLYRTENGDIEETRQNVHPEHIRYSGTTGVHDYPGARYVYSHPNHPETFNGLCMSVHVSQSSPGIIGFHLAGAGQDGVLGTVTQDQLKSVIDELSRNPYILPCASSGDMKTTMFGEQFFESAAIHRKSPMNFLDGEKNVHCYGSVTGRVKAYSSVTQSYISEAVRIHMGVENQWGPPKFKTGGTHYPYQRALSIMAENKIPLPAENMMYAIDDYVEPLLGEPLEMLSDMVRPLTHIETINGIPKCRFINRYNMSSAPGFPLQGPKSELFVFLEPDDVYQVKQDFIPSVKEEIDKAFAVWRSGERYYPPFKACLKDEPTKLTKEKVRVFEASNIVLQYAVRKYYLPVIRLLSLFPLLSECAVGINAVSPEWDQMDKFMKKFGADKIIPGDFSDFDISLSAQLLFSAFVVLRRIAERSGNYSQDDLRIMDMVATEVVYPMIAFNGDLIQVFGINPSGQNLTVYINSIVNSLLHRCGFYSVYPGVRFRSAVALMTYGDDANSSVSPHFPSFNFRYFKEFLGIHGIKFTLFNKEQSDIDYWDQEFDFLKRKSVYIPELGYSLGALDDGSIFKRLHCTMSSAHATEREIVADNINSSIDDWFAHGREVYEERRAQLRKVAEEHDLLVECQKLRLSFDDQVTRWKERYL
jgi:hypothetical protein